MIFRKISVFILILFLIFCNSFCMASSSAPEISAETAVLIDSSTNKIFYGKNETQRMYPASTTKILTAILTLENTNLNDIATVPYDAIRSIPAGYSIAALQTDERLTINQLLQMMMVYSANDAANVLAFHVSGSIENFANLMNEKVSELGLTNTHFTNPSGMHDENHYTTAYDLAIIMQYCMKNSTFRNLAGLKSCTIPATNKSAERTFNTTNNLLVNSQSNISHNSYYEYAIAGKTGFTTPAKNCLVSVASKDNLELICVVLAAGTNADGTSTKFSDSKSLFEYGYDNYSIKTFVEQGSTATQITVANGTDETKDLDLIVKDDISAIIDNDELNNNIEPRIDLNANLVAPISQGATVGKIVYTVDGNEYSSDLLASHNVIPSQSFFVIIQIIALILILFVLYRLLFHKRR